MRISSGERALLPPRSIARQFTSLSLSSPASFGFGPALELAQLTGSAKSAGLGGRLGDAYFGPLFRDGNFDPNWQGKKNADTVVRLNPL